MRVLWTWSGVTALARGRPRLGSDLLGAAAATTSRDGDDLPRQTKYNLPLEIVYTIVPFLIIAGLFYFTVVTEDYVDQQTTNPDVVVQVDAFKWNWQFEYLTGPTARDHATIPGVTPPRKPSVDGRLVDRDPDARDPARPDGPVRRALRGRHPLVLGAGVPVQARRHPVRHATTRPPATTASRSRRRRTGISSAAAPSCAGPTTRR